MTKSFLQSAGWEEFQKSVGNKVFRVDDVLLIQKSLPFNKCYFYIPRADIDIDKVKELAKKENCIFLRIEPADKLQVTSYKLQKVADVQPSKTVILDLDKSEEEILKDMHQKTRYNIRLAEKKGVKIKELNDFEVFWNLMEETTKRDKFRGHGKEYYEKMLSLTPNPSPRGRGELNIKLYAAEYEGKVLAVGIFVFYDDTATYLHGASTHENKNVMAPYLLHWEMIKLAKKQGYKYYDFYGIDEQKWAGITRFKKGFSTEETNYSGAFDVVFNKGWYLVYKIFKKIRKII